MFLRTSETLQSGQRTEAKANELDCLISLREPLAPRGSAETPSSRMVPARSWANFHQSPYTLPVDCKTVDSLRPGLSFIFAYLLYHILLKSVCLNKWLCKYNNQRFSHYFSRCYPWEADIEVISGRKKRRGYRTSQWASLHPKARRKRETRPLMGSGGHSPLRDTGLTLHSLKYLFIKPILKKMFIL